METERKRLDEKQRMIITKTKKTFLFTFQWKVGVVQIGGKIQFNQKVDSVHLDELVLATILLIE